MRFAGGGTSGQRQKTLQNEVDCGGEGPTPGCLACVGASNIHTGAVVRGSRRSSVRRDEQTIEGPRVGQAEDVGGSEVSGG